MYYVNPMFLQLDMELLDGMSGDYSSTNSRFVVYGVYGIFEINKFIFPQNMPQVEGRIE
jgi:hypothetical protein